MNWTFFSRAGTLLTLILLSSSLASAATAGESYSGLWHVIDVKDQSTAFFLVYNGQNSRLYSPNWERIHTSFQVKGNKVLFKYPQGVDRSSVTLDLANGTVTGVFVRPHPQYDWRIALRSHRVSSDPDWQPWGFLHESPASVINLMGAVVEKGPYKSEKDFKEVWSKAIEPRFYALLTHSLYANQSNTYRAGLRTAAPGKLYPIVRKNWDGLKAFAAEFPSMVKKVKADLKRLYPWFDVSGHLVPALETEPVDYRYLVLNNKGQSPRRFMLFGSGWISAHLSQKQKLYMTAQALITLAHRTVSLYSNQFKAEFARRGIAAYLAAQLDYSDDPKDFLFQGKADAAQVAKEYKAFGGLFTHRFRAKDDVARSLFFVGKHRAAAYRFAYDFTRVLAQRYEPLQLIATYQYDRLEDELVAYMRSSKKVPEITKPERAKSTSLSR